MKKDKSFVEHYDPLERDISTIPLGNLVLYTSLFTTKLFGDREMDHAYRELPLEKQLKLLSDLDKLDKFFKEPFDEYNRSHLEKYMKELNRRERKYLKLDKKRK